jgi:DNA-binding transcriptional LysR family regulator
MPSLKQLQALCEVDARGSFSAAADALNYTQPAVSRLVSALEAEVGATLVNRRVHPLRLTDAGEALARRACAVFEQLAAADAEIGAILKLDAGRLRLGTFSSAGATIVAEALAAFRHRFPAVQTTVLEAGPDRLVEAVRSGDVDLAVVFDHPATGVIRDEGLESHHLLDDPSDLFIHPEHRLARRKRVTFAHLRDEDWLQPTFGPDSPTEKLLSAACSAAGFEPRVVFRVNDCEMTKALVAVGMGIALLPRIAVHPAHPGVVVKPVEGSPTRRILAVALPDTRTPTSEAFLQLLQDCAADYPAGRQPAFA